MFGNKFKFSKSTFAIFGQVLKTLTGVQICVWLSQKWSS